MTRAINNFGESGIITASGTVNENEINLISGAMIAPLFETLFTFSCNDVNATNRIYDFLTNLYNAGRGYDILAVLRILHDVTGLQFSDNAELLANHPETLRYLLFSIMLDVDDVIYGIKLDST